MSANRKLFVTLIRHGETTANRDRIIQGHMDVPLSSVGQEQAETLGKRLAHMRLAAIYASDLSRASETASRIARHHSTPVRLDRRLREKSCGALEGMPWNSVRAEAERLGVDYRTFRPEGGGENSMDLRNRVVEFFNEAFQTHAASAGHEDETPHVLFVTHGGVISEFVHHCVQDLLCDVTSFKIGIPQNTSVSTFHFEEVGHSHTTLAMSPVAALAELPALHKTAAASDNHAPHGHSSHLPPPAVHHANHRSHRTIKAHVRVYNDASHLTEALPELKLETL